MDHFISIKLLLVSLSHKLIEISPKYYLTIRIQLIYCKKLLTKHFKKLAYGNLQSEKQFIYFLYILLQVYL